MISVRNQHHSSAGRKSARTRLTLLYFTAWEEPIIHYSVRGGDWTSQVMFKPEYGSAEWSYDEPEIVVDAFPPPSLLEFVITDGRDDWDHAPDGYNYFIAQQGVYQLIDGQLTEL